MTIKVKETTKTHICTINVVAFTLYLSCMIFIMPQEAAAQKYSVHDSILSQAGTAMEARQYQQAINLLNSIPSIEDTTVFQSDKADALLLLSQSYEALGVKKEAYRHFARYRIIKDSLFTREKENMISRLEINYETERKDKEIAEQQLLLKKNEAKALRSNLIIWGGIIGGVLMLLLCMITLGNYRKKQKINKKIREQMQHSHEIEQIQAHIKGTTAERRKIAFQLQQNVYPVIGEASDILKNLEQKDNTLKDSESFSETRHILTEVKNNLNSIGFIHLNDDRHTTQLSITLKDYFDNLPIRTGLVIAFNWSGKEILLPTTHVLHLKRIVQELVHNIIKHSEATQANILLKYTPETLILHVADNGKGFTLYDSKPGMGISNIKERLHVLKGSMIIKETQGTSIQIAVPLYPI